MRIPARDLITMGPLSVAFAVCVIDTVLPLLPAATTMGFAVVPANPALIVAFAVPEVLPIVITPLGAPNAVAVCRSGHNAGADSHTASERVSATQR